MFFYGHLKQSCQSSEGGEKYGEINYDTGNDVKCREERTGSRSLPCTETGWIQSCTFQIPKYGTQFFYHKRRTGDGKSPGDAGRSCRD